MEALVNGLPLLPMAHPFGAPETEVSKVGMAAKPETFKEKCSYLRLPAE
jgi:hypothetical protein